MAVYKSKIKIIEAVEFDPLKPFELPAELKIIQENKMIYTKMNPTKEDCKNVGDYMVYNKLHDSWIKVKQGDMIRIDQPNDHYPIDKKYFEENYLPIEF